MFVKIDWNPNTRDLHKFGLTLLIMLPLMGALIYWKTHYLPALCGLATLGLIVGFCSWTLPSVARLMYKGWMGLAYVLALVVAPVFMSVIFYLVITPIGLLLRMTGKDAMQAKKPQGDTFWVQIEHRTDPKSYGRQF